jgi:hypothetical protein
MITHHEQDAIQNQKTLLRVERRRDGGVDIFVVRPGMAIVASNLLEA